METTTLKTVNMEKSKLTGERKQSEPGKHVRDGKQPEGARQSEDARQSGSPAMVLITGGTGLIGQALTEKLQEKGYTVAILSRKKDQVSGIQTYFWDPGKNKIEKEAVEKSDFIIHLAGANISGKRWSEERKKEIVDSRVETANLLFHKVKRTKNKLKAFISSSGVNYYGTVSSDHIFNEDDPPGSDFMAITCRKWEKSAGRFKELRIRTVIIRNAAALSLQGGALPKMNIPVKLGVAAPIGSGNQYFPWIHIDDLCDIYVKAIEDIKMKGVYNAVAPGHTTNREFMKTLARVQKKPFWAPNAPAFGVKLALGEMAGVVLEGSRASSDKIRSAGFNFRFPELEHALADLINNPV
jgi:uncharacterized protein